MKDYIELELNAGETIEEAVTLLKKCSSEKNTPHKLCFNGHWLYSDTVTLDSAYKEITGKTKEEFEAKIKESQDAYEKQKKEYEEELTKKWIEEGHKILDKSKWKYWDEIVPIRLRDLYQGMELKCCLDIISMLNDNNVSYADIYSVFESQGHSGMSYSLVKSMIIKFSDEGKNFIEYAEIKKYEIVMEKIMAFREKRISTAHSFDHLIEEMNDFKKEHPNGVNFEIESESDCYADYEACFSSLTLSCKDLETDDECNKRIKIEELKRQKDLERKRAEFERLKKELGEE